mmetsp:Transcript_18648/g.43463  ORF Transcript_18648/g.43463 Transcript_18648/m.43463 type:complete len:309 (+) Transcript_18648:1974-2900(+)
MRSTTGCRLCALSSPASRTQWSASSCVITSTVLSLSGSTALSPALSLALCPAPWLRHRQERSGGGASAGGEGERPLAVLPPGRARRFLGETERSSTGICLAPSRSVSPFSSTHSREFTAPAALATARTPAALSCGCVPRRRSRSRAMDGSTRAIFSMESSSKETPSSRRVRTTWLKASWLFAIAPISKREKRRCLRSHTSLPKTAGSTAADIRAVTPSGNTSSDPFNLQQVNSNSAERTSKARTLIRPSATESAASCREPASSSEGRKSLHLDMKPASNARASDVKSIDASSSSAGMRNVPYPSNANS